MVYVVVLYLFFFFKQKTAYEMRISDWSSDVCSSDLAGWCNADDVLSRYPMTGPAHSMRPRQIASNRPIGNTSTRLSRDGASSPGVQSRSMPARVMKIGRASCRERVCQYV